LGGALSTPFCPGPAGPHPARPGQNGAIFRGKFIFNPVEKYWAFYFILQPVDGEPQAEQAEEFCRKSDGERQAEQAEDFDRKPPKI